MKTIITARIYGIDYSTLKKVSFLYKFETDNVFSERKVESLLTDELCSKLNLGKFLTISIEEQADKYLEDIDKSDIIFQKDLHMINNWKIVSVVTNGECLYKDNLKRESLKGVLKEINIDDIKSDNLHSNLKHLVIEIFKGIDDKKVREKTFIDFMVTFDRMYSSIKNLTIEKQIDIVFKSLNIGYDAATEAYRDVIRTYDRLEKEFEEKRKKRQGELQEYWNNKLSGKV